MAEPPEPPEPRVKFSSPDPDLSCSSSLEDLEDLMANLRTLSGHVGIDKFPAKESKRKLVS